MLPKRVLWSLIIIVVIASMTVIGPMIERSAQEAATPNGIPNASPYGYRGLYMVMASLTGKPTHFWQHSMLRLPDKPPITLWFIEPGENMFLPGKAYSEQMRARVRNGDHFIFVLDSNSDTFEEQDMADRHVSHQASAWEYLKKWYDIDPEIDTFDLGETDQVIGVEDALTTRHVAALRYHYIDPSMLKIRAGGSGSNFNTNSPKLIAIKKETLGKGKALVWLKPDALPKRKGDALVVDYPYGKGSITIFPDATFFKNGMLDVGDNAALALALQEMTPGREAMFEGYSQGFADRKDILTSLATGAGAPFLAAMVMLLVLGTWMLASQPVRYRVFRPSSSETRFTQETFIDAMADHYRGTRRWGDLYDRLQRPLNEFLARRFGGIEPQQRIDMIANNPFNDVSQDELTTVLGGGLINTESDFVRRSQQLLDVERKLLSGRSGASSAQATSPWSRPKA